MAVLLLVVLGATVPAAAPPPVGGTERAAVLVEVLHLARGHDRPLPTTVWYPATPGRHPIILFTHALGGLPGHFAPLARSGAANGFVVVAPTYPHTNARVRIDRADVRNQPADAAENNLRQAGLNPRREGGGLFNVVVNQNPGPGSQVPVGTEVVIFLN